MVQYVQSPEVLPGKFTLEKWLGAIGGSALATDQAPNVTPPSADRIIVCRAKRGGTVMMGTIMVFSLWAVGGTSITYALWFYDDTLGAWISVSPAAGSIITVATTPTASVNIGNMSGAKWFPQIVSNNGVVALGYDFR